MAACPAKLSKQGRRQGEGCQGDYQTLEMSCGDEETCQSDNQGNHLCNTSQVFIVEFPEESHSLSHFSSKWNAI